MDRDEMKRVTQRTIVATAEAVASTIDAVADTGKFADMTGTEALRAVAAVIRETNLTYRAQRMDA